MTILNQSRNKVIIIDLDGTAIDSPTQKTASPRLHKAINKLQSKYYISSATGRVWSFAKPALNSLGLTDPCIISAGTQICNPVTEEILWQQIISEESLGEVLAIFRNNNDYKLLHNDGTEDDYFNGGVFPTDFVNREPVYFLEQVFVPDELAIDIYGKLQQIKRITCVMVPAQKPNTRDLHVINENATKEHAVAELLKLIGVDRKNTIGVGDGYNDIHLFNAVSYKVAVGNAVDDLKKQADEIIGSVSQDGLAKYFESLI